MAMDVFDDYRYQVPYEYDGEKVFYLDANMNDKVKHENTFNNDKTYEKFADYKLVYYSIGVVNAPYYSLSVGIQKKVIESNIPL